jgi:C-terminal processing protease CtpA/Prc
LRYWEKKRGLASIGVVICIALFLTSGAAVPRELGKAGIGVTLVVEKGTGRCLIFEVLSGGPAERAGLRAGDCVSEVDGKPVRGMSLEQVLAAIRGKEGTTVRITMEGKSAVDLVRQDLSGLSTSAKTQGVRCPKCVAASPPGAKFCGACGASLAPAASKEKGGASTYEHIVKVYQKGLDVLEANYQELASIATTNR